MKPQNGRAKYVTTWRTHERFFRWIPAICATCMLLPNTGIASDSTGSADPCSQAAASISIVTPAPIQVLEPIRQNGVIKAEGHIYVRNDGSGPLSHWCTTVFLFDLTGSSLPQRTTCQALQVPPGAIQDLTLSVEAQKNQLPVSGIVTVGATGEVAVKVVDKGEPSAGTPGSPKTVSCPVSAKQISQNIIVPAVASTSNTLKIIAIPGLVSLVFLIFCTYVFRDQLGDSMGASEWGFSSSAATNLTVVSGLLTTVLTSSVLPEYPHFLTKQSYLVLSLLFAVLAGLSPVLYNFCCRPTQPDSASPDLLDFEGSVFLFLLAAAITIWAVFGQLSTLGLLFSEFSARQLTSSWSAGSAWAMGAAVGLSLLIYCYRVARFYAPEHRQPIIGTTPTSYRVAQLYAPERPATEPQVQEERLKIEPEPPPRRRPPRWKAL